MYAGTRVGPPGTKQAQGSGTNVVGVWRGRLFSRQAGHHRRSHRPCGSSAGGQLAYESVGIDVVGRLISSSAPAPSRVALSVGGRSIAFRLRGRRRRGPPPLVLVAFLWAAGPLPSYKHQKNPTRS